MTANFRDPNAKLKHIDACLLDESQYKKSAGFDRFDFSNEAGVPLALDSIDLSTDFCERRFAAPLMISPMTGGVERGAELNRLWAGIAEKFQVPMGVGSQRIAIEEGDRAGLFQLRKIAPTAFIFANLGAANLTRANAGELARKAVDMIEANAMFVHFNAMQEACQNADTDFGEALQALEIICSVLRDRNVKVFAREVGFGLSTAATQRFLNAGVDGIDCAGAGGTSWSKVEAMCAENANDKRLGQVFCEWGIPTSQSILNVRAVSRTIPLVATGGVRSGLDVAKAIALGADMVGMARPMLLAANASAEVLEHFVASTLHEIKVSMFGAGIVDIKTLRKINLGSPDSNLPKMG
jgi:isopentenyl-diphosphate delta-isomerase